MKHIIQKLGMIVAMLLSSLSASAYDFKVDGIYYKIVSLDELTCAVTNHGDNYNGIYNGDITIPSEVTINGRTLSVISIEQEAFSYCDGLTSVVIPNSVTEIGTRAFRYCYGLTSVTISNSVTEIGAETFAGCTGLTSVTIPNSVTKIGQNAFSYCTGLTSVSIPNSVTEILFGAFYDCTGLTSVDIPNSVTYLDGFTNCTGLTSVTIPNSVTKIGGSAFSNCTGLTSVTIPNSVTYLDGFTNCTGLTSVTIPNSVTYIGWGAFSGCTGLTSVAIPNSVTKIDNEAFKGCTGLTSLEILASVTKLEHHEFCECNSLESLTLPPSLVEISTDNDNASFLNCNNIKKLIILGDENSSKLTFKGCYIYKTEFSKHEEAIPFSNLKLEELYLGRVVKTDSYARASSLEAIKKITFGKYLKVVGSGLYGLINEIPTTAEIYCENPTPPSGATYFTNTQYISNVVYVPRESLEAYKQAEGWKNFWDIRAYDPASGIKDVSVDDVRADVFKVYNLAGMLVKETADKTEAYDLPAGIYIINGRKVAIR